MLNITQTPAGRSAGRARVGMPRSGEVDRFEQLIGAVYEGATEDPPWRSALDLLQQQLGADHIVLILRPPTADSGALMINPLHEDLAARQRYEQRYFSQDPFIGIEDGEVVTAEEKVGSHWQRSAYYQDYLRPLGIGHILGADLHIPGGIECRLRATRGTQHTGFSDADRTLCRALLPHLKRSIELHARLDRAQCDHEIVSSAIGRLTLGMIWLAGDGSVLRCNEEARRILEERDGLFLAGKSLMMDSAQENKTFQKLVDAAAGQPDPKARRGNLAPGMAVSRPSGRTRLTLMLKPAPQQRWAGAAQRRPVVVFLRDPDSRLSLPTVDLVCRLLDLTRTEARLALLLAAGHSTDEVASLMNIRRNTARTHLRSIFYKTGVTRQTLLVRLLLNSIGTLG